jgi:ABC-type multidrug transport system ATPase subunit
MLSMSPRQPAPRSRQTQVGLRVDGVTKRWRKRPQPVLDNVDLGVEPGSLAWIVGSNGAGKTTLVRIIAGLLQPEIGRVSLSGLSASEDRGRYYQQLGVVSAGDRGLYARLTTLNHLAFWSRLALVPRERREQTVARAVDQFELQEILNARVDRLSMGQRQRLRLSLALLHRPSLLLLDEPTSSLDDTGIKLLERAVAELLEHGGMCVWVSPGVEQVGIAPTQTLLLKQGRLMPR